MQPLPVVIAHAWVACIFNEWFVETTISQTKIWKHPIETNEIQHRFNQNIVTLGGNLIQINCLQ